MDGVARAPATCAWLLLAAQALVTPGCGRSRTETEGAASASAAASALVMEAPEDEDAPGDAGAGQRRESARAAGERVSIPAAPFVAGSVPGDRGRDPELEPAPTRFELGAFDIDRLPYPNDPSAPPRTGVDRATAEQLCAERSGRLCTELEWERACKGPDAQPYAGASRWDPSCAAAPATCASGFGVLAMGAGLRELTASDVEPAKKTEPRLLAVRGARSDAADVDHRCAHRVAASPDLRADDVGFRCCYGPRNPQTIAVAVVGEPYRISELPAAELEAMLRSVPKLASLAGDVKYFREESAIVTVQKRGEGARSVKGLPSAPPDQPRDLPPDDDLAELRHAKLTTAPLLWNPVAGEELLVVTGRAGTSSFVVALHRFVGESGAVRYRVGSALVLEDEPGPIVLGYDPDVRRRLHWAGCIGCYGESGRITYREDRRVVITQQ